jgi:2-phospho-L-lactate guanylyltransferase
MALVRSDVDLVVPVKTLDRAKSRLLGAADGGAGDPGAHAALALALALDTIAAAVRATRVRSVITVTSDPVVVAELDALGVETLADPVPSGLNEALRHGAALLRERDPGSVVGALQADLPALRPAELDDAVARAGGRRAFCPDRQGTGTVLLLSARGGDLDPRFGVGSAAAHGADAHLLSGHWPSLRTDVDTAADLDAAAAVGLGPRTAALRAAACARR